MDLKITKDNLVGFGTDSGNMLISVLDETAEVPAYHWLSFSAEALKKILEEHLARTSKFYHAIEDFRD